jgi:hypothetical protein
MPDPRTLFERTGEAMYGPNWTVPLAAALRVSERSVRYWRGGRAIPDGIWDDLVKLGHLRRVQIGAVMDDIEELAS